MPQPFATVDELATFVGKTVNTAQATLALEIASDVIRAETGQTISLVENDVVTLRGSSSNDLALPERPVLSVSHVEGTDSDWTFTGDRLSRFGGWTSAVTVTYSHGFAIVPSDVRGVCLALASRIIGSQTLEASISAETVGNYRIDYARSVDATRGGLLEAERAQLRRTYRPSAGMLSLR